MIKQISIEEEKKYEIKNVLDKKERYLKTNPMERYYFDDIYRKKVQYIENELKGIHGLILDLGGNTAGEAIILSQIGFHFIVGDINEYALDISQERGNKFNLQLPQYVAFDAHVIPFEDNTFDAVTVIEALHHFIDYDKVLKEIYRVLRPGGKFISLEPYALNPIRRLSEARDYFKGTVEKSFTKKKMKRLLNRNYFINEKIITISMGKSSWKMEEIPLYRKPIAYLHSFLAKKIPILFGTLLITAFKDQKTENSKLDELEFTLICPITKTKLHLDEEVYLLVNKENSYGYKLFNKIPVLIANEAQKL